MAYGKTVDVDVDPGADPEPDPEGGTFQKIPLEGSKITASDTDGNNTPGKVADGDAVSNDGKRWIGVLYPPAPAWLKIDLGEITYVEYVDIYFRFQNHPTDASWKPHTYKLQYAVTAEGADQDFTDVFEETRQSLSDQPYNREEIKKPLRWLKILITDSAKAKVNSPNKWVSIHEVEVYGGN
jgi:hypothetical protein